MGANQSRDNSSGRNLPDVEIICYVYHPLFVDSNAYKRVIIQMNFKLLKL